jgi:hypothetical protein
LRNEPGSWGGMFDSLATILAVRTLRVRVGHAKR